MNHGGYEQRLLLIPPVVNMIIKRNFRNSSALYAGFGLVVFIGETLHDDTDGMDIGDGRGNLSDFEFSAFHVTLEDAALGGCLAQDGAQFFGLGPSCLRFSQLLVERVLH